MKHRFVLQNKAKKQVSEIYNRTNFFIHFLKISDFQQQKSVLCSEFQILRVKPPLTSSQVEGKPLQKRQAGGQVADLIPRWHPLHHLKSLGFFGIWKSVKKMSILRK